MDPSVNVSSCLYVWDAESDTVIFHDFLNERGSSASRRMFGGTGGGGDATTINASTVLPVDDDDGASQDSNDALLASNHDVKKELRETSVLKIPLAHYWSSDDPRILTCEVRRVQIKNAVSSSQFQTSNSLVVLRIYDRFWASNCYHGLCQFFPYSFAIWKISKISTKDKCVSRAGTMDFFPVSHTLHTAPCDFRISIFISN